MVSKPRRSPGRPKDDQLPERRRQEILPFAVHHFATVGYHAADLDQIAASIGCAKGTLYRYFPSKKELFEASVDFVMTELIQNNETLPRLDDLVLEMCNWLHATLKFFDEHPEYVELLLQERAAFRDRSRPSFFDYCEAHEEFWTQRMPKAIKDGIVRDMCVETIRQVGITQIYGAIFINYFSKDTNTYEMRARQLNEVFLNGILTPEGSARFYKDRPDLAVHKLPPVEPVIRTEPSSCCSKTPEHPDAQSER
jgi:AcrR family transcriptional regulator